MLEWACKAQKSEDNSNNGRIETNPVGLAEFPNMVP